MRISVQHECVCVWCLMCMCVCVCVCVCFGGGGGVCVCCVRVCGLCGSVCVFFRVVGLCVRAFVSLCAY